MNEAWQIKDACVGLHRMMDRVKDQVQRAGSSIPDALQAKADKLAFALEAAKDAYKAFGGDPETIG